MAESGGGSRSSDPEEHGEEHSLEDDDEDEAWLRTELDRLQAQAISKVRDRRQNRQPGGL